MFHIWNFEGAESMEHTPDLSGYPSLKALLILETLARNGDYIGINEIVKETGLSQATVHRILSEMVETRYV